MLLTVRPCDALVIVVTPVSASYNMLVGVIDDPVCQAGPTFTAFVAPYPDTHLCLLTTPSGGNAITAPVFAAPTNDKF